MTETKADIGYNGSFGIEGETAGVYVDLAEVKAITPPGFSREKQDATHLKSPDSYKEYVMALFDTDDASITLNFTPQNLPALWAAFHAPQGGKYQITFPDGQQMRFTGAFTGMSLPELTPEGVMESSGTITRTSGKPTLHPAPVSGG